MKGMTLDQFVQTMIEYDEIEFSYCSVAYNFQKEDAEGGLIRISVWQGGKNPKCCYTATVANDHDSFQVVAQKLIHEKILFDGNSIAEGDSDIAVEFFT